jgi:hypothetical protein
MSLNELRDQALDIAVRHGFKDASVGEDVALMHSELSEALEDHRNGCLPHELRYDAGPDRPPSDERLDAEGKLRKPVGIPSEMADILIRVFHFCGKHGIDLDYAVAEKTAYNESRPFRHGNKKL